MTFLPGDIAACHGADFVSRVIRYATASIEEPFIGPSHVAILAPIEFVEFSIDLFTEAQPETREREEVRWFESTSLCDTPCLMQGRPVWGFQLQRPEDRIQHYLDGGGRVDLYRLVPIHQLTDDEAQQLTVLLLKFVGVSYDLAGAMLSGTRLFQTSKLFPGADLHSVFCSELIAAVLQRLGRMTLSNPTRFNPARLLRSLVRSGVYSRVETFA